MYRKSNVFSHQVYQIDEPPNQLCDYICSCNFGTRFDEICNIYLKGLSMEDVKYMCPEDLINLVPADHYRHKLLMTILVRRYLCRCCEFESCCCDKNSTDSSKSSKHPIKPTALAKTKHSISGSKQTSDVCSIDSSTSGISSISSIGKSSINSSSNMCDDPSCNCNCGGFD